MVWLIVYPLVIASIYCIVTWLIGCVSVSNIRRRSVLITGCDSGFGNGLVFKCLRAGMTVFAGYFTEEGGEKLRKAARQLGATDRLHAIQLDITNPESVAKCAEKVRSILDGEGLHGLVNNAGAAGINSFDDWLTPEVYRSLFEINTLGMIRMTHAFKPLLKKAKGRIVNTASICGRLAIPFTGPYNVSKFGVEAYSDTIRVELRDFGVSVHIIEPGFFQTALTSPQSHTKIIQKQWDSLSAETKKEYGEEMLHYMHERVKKELDALCSPNIHLVVDTYFHALTSVWPRRRYTVGPDSTFFFIPFSFVPAILQDHLYQLASWLTNNPKPRALRKT